MNASVSRIANGTVGVVAISGEIDFSVVPEVRKALEEAFEGKCACVLVDLSGVSFIASDGLGALIEAQRRAQADGRKLHLVHPQPHILELLRKTQLTRLFQIHESIDEAVKSCP